MQNQEVNLPSRVAPFNRRLCVQIGRSAMISVQSNCFRLFPSDLFSRLYLLVDDTYAWQILSIVAIRSDNRCSYKWWTRNTNQVLCLSLVLTRHTRLVEFHASSTFSFSLWSSILGLGWNTANFGGPAAKDASLMGDSGIFLEEMGGNPPGVDELPIEASGSAYRLDGALIGGPPFFFDDTALLGGAISAANGAFEAATGVLDTSEGAPLVHRSNQKFHAWENERKKEREREILRDSHVTKLRFTS